VGAGDEPVKPDRVPSPPLRIGLLGTGNTHAYPIVGFLNGWADEVPIPDRSLAGLPAPDMHLWARTLRGYDGDPEFRARFRGARVTRIWSEVRSDAHRVAQAGGIEQVAATPEEAMEQVDAIMILTEEARSHERLGAAALRRGVPTFIDKPMASSRQEALRLFRLADSAGVPCWSGSSIRFSQGVADLRHALARDAASPRAVYVQCPLDLEVYGVHGMEVVGVILGFEGIDRMAAEKLGDRQVVSVSYRNGRTAVVDLLNFLSRSVYTFVVYTDSRQYVAEHASDGRSILAMLERLLEMFRGGDEPYPRRESLASLALVDAAVRSLHKGSRSSQLARFRSRR
jgi:hypothetical protein